MGMKITNYAEVTADFNKYSTKVDKKNQKTLLDTAKKVKNEAKAILNARIIHKDKSTGNLEASIDYKVFDKEAIIEATESYAGYVELGTGSFTGHHYLRDAMNKYITSFINKIKNNTKV